MADTRQQVKTVGSTFPRSITAILLTLILLGSPGCGTLIGFSGLKNAGGKGASSSPLGNWYVYNGVQTDLELTVASITVEDGKTIPVWLRSTFFTLSILDLPLSFGADTLLLPAYGVVGNMRAFS